LPARVAGSAPTRQNGYLSTPEHPSDPELRTLQLSSGPISAGLRFAPIRWLLMPIVRRGWRKMGFPRSTPEASVVQSVHWTAALDFEVIAADVEALGRTGTPTLLAWTEDDKLVESAIARELAEALPAGPRLSLSEGGHNLQKTCAVEIGAALADFALGSAA